MSRKRKYYSSDYKIEVVKYLQSSGKSCREVGEEFGITANTVWKWKRQYEKQGEAGFSRAKTVDHHEAECIRLRKELANANERCEILKKAIAIFSPDGK